VSSGNVTTGRSGPSAPREVRSTKPCPRISVLTIAGSDSGGGAGIQADSRTIQALGGFAATAITAVTAQNTRGVLGWSAVEPKLLAQQISAVCEDLAIAAIKTGLLPGAAAVDAVLRALKPFPRIPLVVDPVIGSTSGTRFLSTTGLRRLRDGLLPRATLVTPNWPEAAALSGLPVNQLTEAEAAGRAILKKTGCPAVLVKGGHASGPKCEDLLITADGQIRAYRRARIDSLNTHGTGCVLSAAIATRLACGDDLSAAVATAIAFLHRALRRGRDACWGGGHGPAFAG